MRYYVLPLAMAGLAGTAPVSTQPAQTPTPPLVRENATER